MSLRCALRAAACAARRGPAAAAARSVAPLSAALGLRRAGGVPAAGSHSDFLPKAKGTGGAGGEAEVKAAALAEIDKVCARGGGSDVAVGAAWRGLGVVSARALARGGAHVDLRC